MGGVENTEPETQCPKPKSERFAWEGLKKTESEPQCPKPKKVFCIVVETVVHLMEDKTKFFCILVETFVHLMGWLREFDIRTHHPPALSVRPRGHLFVGTQHSEFHWDG